MGRSKPVAKRGRRTNLATSLQEAQVYRHPEAESPLRPDVGTQPQFRKKKPPVTYRYDSSLSPALAWDGQNSARELGEWLLGLIETAAALPPPHVFDKPQEFKRSDGKIVAKVRNLQDAVTQLTRISRSFLNWAGKAERLSFEVPTLPLFVHERLSTKGIIETLKGHRKDKGAEQLTLAELFGDPQRPVTDQVLKAYEYRDKWVNRMILGDSLVVMNSLLHYEGLGGQVQMIYMDPPYGIGFGSNFQPFVRKREVVHNDDEDMTREPEIVKAYRDTWELGLHSYLTYLRDRLLLYRELLAPSGSVFVQISDENLHHVREVMDEVFGEKQFLSLITFEKTSGSTTLTLPTTSDYLLWYARDAEQVKFHKVYMRKTPGLAGAVEYRRVELPDGAIAAISQFIQDGRLNLPEGARIFATGDISSKGGDDPDIILEWEGKSYRLSCKPNRHWKVGPDGIKRLWEAGRLLRQEGLRIYKRYFDDFPYAEITHVWIDTRGEAEPMYVVQTHTSVAQRCLLMTTDPGDLVLDPTCGSGTTAYVAEHWGRRWITIDISRVPLALARQRLLTATFPYYRLKDESRGPASGFDYRPEGESQNPKSIGPGIVPHITPQSIANNEPPDEEVLVDRPEIESKITRVTGPFTVEATIPTPVDWDGDGIEDSGAVKLEEHGSFVDRMLEVMRKSPVLHLGDGKTVTLKNIRPPAKTLSLSAEAVVTNPHPSPLPEGEGGQAVALVFGPENGAISEKLVYEAAREAHAKSYAHLYVIGFAIQPNARKLAEDSDAAVGIPSTYVQATPDLMMGDLLKNMRSSQIFSVCGLPEVKLHRLKPTAPDDPVMYQAELLGLDVFDPTTMETDHRSGGDVPAWFLDTDYNGLCFHVTQAFFPRTSAWDHLKKALKGLYEDSLWDHLAGTKSAPFESGEHGQVAVKVIDDRGNELLVVMHLKEAVG
jgi:adenine-specific DNA-methyltransferase